MKYLLIILLTFLFISCATTEYVMVPYTTPPEKYMPNRIRSNRDFINEYSAALFKIQEWQRWYNVNNETNYYFYTKEEKENY